MHGTNFQQTQFKKDTLPQNWKFAKFGRYIMFAKEAVHFSFLCFIRSDKGTLKYSFSISRCFSLFILCYYSLLGYAIFLRIQFSGASWMERNTFVQFKKPEKHPWKSVNFSKFAGWSFSLHHLYNLKNVKNTYGVVLILVKLQAEALACNFTKIDAPPWVFFLRFLNCANCTKLRNAPHLWRGQKRLISDWKHNVGSKFVKFTSKYLDDFW